MENAPEEFIEIDVDNFLARHDQLLISAASAIEQDTSYHEADGSKVVFDASWEDGEYRYYLTSQTKARLLDITEPNQIKLDSDYFLRKESSMPGHPHEKYHFSTYSKEVRFVDEKGNKVQNRSLVENNYNLDIVLDYLNKRDGIVPLDSTILELELGYYLADSRVRSTIARLAKSRRHSARRRMLETKIENHILSIMREQPLFSEDVLRGAIDAQMQNINKAA